MKRREMLTTTLGGGAASLIASARNIAQQPTLAGLDEYVARMRTEWKNVGVAISVVRGTEMVYARGFGDRELGKRAPITPDSLFQIGSTSKAFTTAALGILVDQGRLRWDDRVADHLPGFQLEDPWLTRHLTIRDAAAHRSGVSDNYYPYLAIKTKDEVVRHLRYLVPDGEFRDSFRYNNLMYAALGQVIAAVSGMTWDEFVEQRLFTRLAMKRSGTSAYQYWDGKHVGPTFYGSAPGGRGTIDAARDGDLAMPHGLDEAGSVKPMPWISFDSAGPAGSVVSSVADLANWLILHLEQGRFGGREIVRKDTMWELHTTQNLRGSRSAPPLENVTGALGWFRAEYHGEVHLAHGGGMLGFPAYIAMLPERKIGIVVLSNGPTVLGDDYKFHRSIAFWVFDRLLGRAPKDWSREFLAEIGRIEQEGQKAAADLGRSRLLQAPPSLPLEAYAGDYEDRKVPSGLVRVRVENDELVVRFAGEGAFTGHLEHWHNDQFRLHSRAPGHNIVEFRFADFAIGPRAKVSSMTVSSAYFRLTMDRLES